MNTHIKKLSAYIGASIFALGLSYAQDREYDDLYFMPSDRVKVKEVKPADKVVQNATEVQQITSNPQENFSSKTVNPEYLARYSARTQEDYSGDSQFASDEYYDDDYNRSYVNDFQNNADVVVRDRYGNTTYFRNRADVYWSDPMFYRGSFYDPFYNPYAFGNRPFRSGWSVSFGFGNNWRWRNRWNSGFAVGYGWGWGNRWDFYDPFWSNGFCDPFYAGYSPYYYGSFYGYGNPWRNNVVVINNYESRSNRTYQRGPSTSRSGAVVTNGGRGRSTNNDGGITNGRSSSGNGRIASSDSRDYSSTQSRYYRRSREAVSGSPANTGSSTGRTYNTRSRSTSNYTQQSGSVNRGRTTTSPTYTTPSRSGRSNSSYSTPSRTRPSGNYSNGSRSGSRSNSSGYSSGSRSRSSGSSSGSYSSGSRSRSSSSGSSSGGGRSRRGGN